MKRQPEEAFNDIIKQLGESVYTLISECYDRGYRNVNPELVKAITFLADKVDKKKTIELFIRNSYDYWNNIKERDQDFFLEHSDLVFGDLTQYGIEVNAFKVLIEAKDKNGIRVITEEEEEILWEYFDVLVEIAKKYISLHKNLFNKITQNGYSPYLI